MPITIKEVEKYINKLRPDLKSSLQYISELLLDARENNGIPIYLTKGRIKSTESTYLKTKRQHITDLKEITDLVGFRVLCLFEKDILITHKHLMTLFGDKGFKLQNFKMYNWSKDIEDPFINKIKEEVSDLFKDVDIIIDKKKSGYKSIHYIVTRISGLNNYPIEIQLRTLLQDVWGELEHSLSYKRGSIHPHIKQSFKLLARDLETNDELLTHLRDISEKEQCCIKFSNRKTGPRNFFGYDDDLMPEIFKHGKIKEYVKQYLSIFDTLDLKKQKKDWISKARKTLTSIKKELRGTDFSDNKVKYFLDMEDAFMFFSEGQYDKALVIYEDVLKNFKSHYILHYRIGEMLFLKGKTERALAAFDESERLLKIESDVDYKNKYSIKLRLALFYWSLGDEFIDIAINQINEAEKMVNDKEGLFSTKERNILKNNLCWYYLEKYIIDFNDDSKNKDKSYKDAYEKFVQLESIINDTSTSNSLDTAAWFCFHTYMKTGERSFLERAKNYCYMASDRVNYTSFNFVSMNIHQNHIQEIMNCQ